MSKWVRIGDNDIANFGNKNFRMKNSDDNYVVFADECNQGFVKVRHHDCEAHWTVELKLRKNDCFKLCVMAAPLPGILNDWYWYELIIGSRIAITYWGDRKIFRSDSGFEIN